jgi:hypothetical protein
LAIDEKAYGPDHPQVAVCAGNIGAILHAQGDPVAALPYARRALRIFAATYGPDHPDTKLARRNLAFLEQALAKRGKRSSRRKLN